MPAGVCAPEHTERRHGRQEPPGPGAPDRPALTPINFWVRRRKAPCIAPPARQVLDASFTDLVRSRRREGRPTCLLHPDDAARLGIAADDAVEVGNARGRVRLHARLAEGQQPGIVVVEGLWPSADFADGRGINAPIGDAPAGASDGAVYHDTALWVRAA